MIISTLINDIFDLAFDDIQESNQLRQQIKFLTIGETEHTGVGLYLHFLKDNEIYKYKVSKEKNISLNGVEILNEKLGILADVIVHIENGIINCIEIWNKSGENYPTNEPQNYELTQIWIDTEKRRTIKR